MADPMDGHSAVRRELLRVVTTAYLKAVLTESLLAVSTGYLMVVKSAGDWDFQTVVESGKLTVGPRVDSKAVLMAVLMAAYLAGKLAVLKAVSRAQRSAALTVASTAEW